VACGGSDDEEGQTAPPTGNVTATCDYANFQDGLQQAINNARAQSRMRGSTPYAATAAVTWHDALYRAAAGHSEDMAVNNYFAHTSPSGRTLGMRLQDAGCPYRIAGENIAFNYRSIADVMAAWIASPGHCANIMERAFREVGVACVRNGDGEPYWTMDLGAR
jgi:uncharacterized protein YkwD